MAQRPIFVTRITTIGVDTLKNIFFPVALVCSIALIGCSDGGSGAIKPEKFADVPAKMPEMQTTDGPAPPAKRGAKPQQLP